MQAALTRENLQTAFKRVRGNKGAASVDGLDIDQASRYRVKTWPAIRDCNSCFLMFWTGRVLLADANSQGLANTGRVAASPAASHPAQALEAWQNDVPGTACTWSAVGGTHRVAANSRCWWRNSDRLLKTVLTIEYFDRLGVPRLSSPQLLEPPGADSHAGWCGRSAVHKNRPYADWRFRYRLQRLLLT